MLRIKINLDDIPQVMTSMVNAYAKVLPTQYNINLNFSLKIVVQNLLETFG